MALMEFARQKQVKSAGAETLPQRGVDPQAPPQLQKQQPVAEASPRFTGPGKLPGEAKTLPGAKRVSAAVQRAPQLRAAQSDQTTSNSDPRANSPAISSQMPEPQSVMPQPSEAMPVMGATEIATLKSLAAMQMKYGQPQEAAAYLMMVRKFAPDDADALRLLVAALIKLKRNDQAEVILAEYETLTGASRNDGGLGLLYRSIITLRTSGIATARGWFEQFRKFIAGGVKARIK